MLHVNLPHRHHILLAPLLAPPLTVPPSPLARDTRPGIVPAFMRLLFVLSLIDPAIGKTFAVRSSRAGDLATVDAFDVLEALGAGVA